MTSDIVSNSAWRATIDVAVAGSDGASLDREVQRLLSRGDAGGALRHIMQCYGDSVYQFCCTMLGDRVLAEDVQQQTFFEAFRDLPRFQGRSSLRSWIFGIARHRAYDAVKARRRSQARISPEDVSDQLADEPDPRPQPDESVDATRLQAALVASLDDLREPVRKAVVLRYHEGFTFEQIAKECGDTPGTHHARVMRALRRLRAGIESRIQDAATDSTCGLRRLPACQPHMTRAQMPTGSGKLNT